jgi:hypothetical protein
MSDVSFQDISTVGSDKSTAPKTLASAATVAPTTFLTFFTGTVQLATITPPVSGHHMLVFVFTNASPGAFVTTGNIKNAVTPIQNVPVFLVYDPQSAKYYASAYVS